MENDRRENLKWTRQKWESFDQHMQTVKDRRQDQILAEAKLTKDKVMNPKKYYISVSDKKKPTES